MLQIASGVLRQMHNPIRLVDENARRSHLVESLSMNASTESSGWRQTWSRLKHLLRHPQSPKQSGQLWVLFTGMRTGLIDAGFSVDDLEQAGWAICAFRRAEKEEAVWLQGIVENGTHKLLKLTVEIDQQIATGDEIKVRERRIL